MILVTGGSGVVGSAVVRHLSAAGDPPRALSRSEPSDARLRVLGATPVRGDVLDPESLAVACAGVSVVYHVAGINQMCSRDPDLMDRVNVDGSLNVVRAAAAAGARLVVHTSSATTIGEPRGVVGTETTPHRGWFLSRYEESKHRAEEALLGSDHGVGVVSVNPSSVQGPGRATGTGKLILDLVNGRLPALVDTRLSVVDVDDCARGHLLAAEHGRPGERYLLNSFTVTMREAVGMLARALDRQVDVRFVPGPVAAGLAAVVEAGFRAARRRPPVCREMIRTLRHGHAYDGSRAERELGLGYTGPVELLTRLVAWFRAEGLAA